MLFFYALTRAIIDLIAFFICQYVTDTETGMRYYN
jgi:hypothetical protein